MNKSSNIEEKFITDNMEDFFKAMNDDREHDRYKKWEHHRMAICDTMKDTLDRYEVGKNIIIFGAGNCDDIDFGFLDKYFEEIYLTDIDSDNLSAAVDSIKPNIRKKIEIIGGVDVSGLSDYHFFEKFEKVLETGQFKKVKKFLIKSSNEVNNSHVLREYRKKFSMVASSAIFSQIFFPQAFFMLSKYQNKFTSSDLNKIKLEIGRFTDIIVGQYNELIISMGKERAFIIAWSDAYEITEKQLVDLLKEQKSFKKKTGGNFFNGLHNKYHGNALSGGLKGVMNLGKYIASDAMLLRSWPWLFSDKKYYICYCITGMINNNSKS